MSPAAPSLVLVCAAALLGCGPQPSGAAPSSSTEAAKAASPPPSPSAPSFEVDPAFAALVPPRPPPTSADPLARPEPRGLVEAELPEVEGPRKLDEIRELVATRSPELVGCYEAALPVMPELAGELGLRFTVKPSGEVVDAEALEGSTFGHERAAACMLRGLERWQWAPIPAGLTRVEYRLRFSSSAG